MSESSVSSVSHWRFKMVFDSRNNKHGAPPYLMRVFSVVIIMKGLCLWTTVFHSRNSAFSVYWLMFTVPSIDPRRRPSKRQALTGSYPSCWGSAAAAAWVTVIENADYSRRTRLFCRHPNFGQIVVICVKENQRLVTPVSAPTSPSCVCVCVCMWLIFMSCTKATGHHSGTDKLNCGLAGILMLQMPFLCLQMLNCWEGTTKSFVQI